MRRENRNSVRLMPDKLEDYQQSDAMWYETPEERKAGLEWGRRKQVLLRWVRRQMRRRLRLRERRFLEMRYFDALTFKEIGQEGQIDPSHAWKIVKRSIAKLQKAAWEDKAWKKQPFKRKTKSNIMHSRRYRG
ncbi:MAG TPA: sigma factor-like helix-turn-helix DNA-binding protein [Candidatus Hydrogenedentes bacterium]|nr:sigma factor-like helix-turn-helix DNA-binding protein [Candidatus Hydrogenedentota bacterium]